MPQLSDLVKGEKIKVIKEFLDFDKYKVEAGRLLTFKEYSYFAYDGGYTFDFEEYGFRLAEIDEDNLQVLNRFSEYFEVIG